MPTNSHPAERLAAIRREFGEHGGVNMSVESSSTFTVMKPDTLPALFEGHVTPQEGCYLYGRSFNPTVYHLSRQIAAIEGTEAAYCTASGMAAISAALLHLCQSGDHIVASHTVYGGTYALTHDFLPAKANIHTSFVDVSDLAAVDAAITDTTKVIYAESIANPTLRVADISGLSAIARRHGIALVIDNTFAPMVISPAQLGADVVVHSLTKYMNGASDVVAGAICGTGTLITGLMDLHQGPLMILGPTMDPAVAASISMRLPHLAIRMTEHAKRAQIFAERLTDLGMTVSYPGLPSHPDYQLMQDQGCADFGAGGILTVDLGTPERAEALMDRLQNDHAFGLIAVSLGYFDTLMSAPSSSTSSEMTPEDMVKSGIGRGLVRMSIGYTGSVEQRWSQLESALEAVGVIAKGQPRLP